MSARACVCTIMCIHECVCVYARARARVCFMTVYLRARPEVCTYATVYKCVHVLRMIYYYMNYVCMHIHNIIYI